ncbi:hypothetical protein HYPSUDRAFT_37814 [Hypholoma sublateritium FD-334 SS-4]|uniref:Uncharacterized protein n=1 Tax=Hypholoma sublateritium (strain FD-334 SS-4) TaxID=945553 RepID=A0A0D2P9N5_HYPSF|nr:hypothetical protein HYPSUDRAFT_37814 [Hypholoma sublateritium FD-334 SS-4]
MLAKVSKRVRRRSIQEFSTSSREQWTTVVNTPPDLVRWCDFADPFPLIAPGGYARYYASVGPKIAEAPHYCPLLSQCSDNLSVRETPRQTPLFPQPPARTLGTIREASVESMTPKRPISLTVSTSAPTSLRRQHRRLLRTPSIERDFAVYGRHFLSSTASRTGAGATPPGSHSSAHLDSPTAHSRSASSDSAHSESIYTDSAHSEYPVTPSTSIDSDDEFGDNMFARVLYKDDGMDELLQRPDSRTSFSTAKSGFSDA